MGVSYIKKISVIKNKKKYLIFWLQCHAPIFIIYKKLSEFEIIFTMLCSIKVIRKKKDCRE